MGTKFTNPRVHVTMLDGAEWDAQTLNPDLLRFERTAVKHKWAPPSESPVQWLTFIAWAAGIRTGELDAAVSWESFSTELCAEVTNPDGREPSPAVLPTGEVPDTD